MCLEREYQQRRSPFEGKLRIGESCRASVVDLFVLPLGSDRILQMRKPPAESHRLEVIHKVDHNIKKNNLAHSGSKKGFERCYGLSEIWNVQTGVKTCVEMSWKGHENVIQKMPKKHWS